MTVSAVIPNWNGEAFLSTLLDDLAAQTHPFSEIIVVDNGSTDGSCQAAERRGARVVRIGENRGFAAAVNRGIQEARCSAIAVLNNDVQLPPDWLARLVAALDREDVWFATGKILSAANPAVLDATFDTICRGACAWRSGSGRVDSPLWNRSRLIGMAPLTAALFRRDLFERVGMLDEIFETYLEDVDFGLRCAAAGYTGVYVPDARALHVGSATLGRWHGETVRRMARNQLLMVARHYPAGWIWHYGWPVAVAQCLWILVALRRGCLVPCLKGKWEGIRRFRSARRQPLRGISQAIEQSEVQLRELQREAGFDAYWRIYFALT